MENADQVSFSAALRESWLGMMDFDAPPSVNGPNGSPPWDIFETPENFGLPDLWSPTSAPLYPLVATAADADPMFTALETLRSAVSLADVVPTTVFDPRVERFLTRPLVCRAYDHDMLSILLEVFKIHVAPVLTSFAATLRVIEQNSEGQVILREQLLAMAALGTTFCDLPHSRAIARVLFADSHRMLCNSFSTAKEALHTPQLKISHAQTLIALQLFGLCSGHKRAHELAEGYHSALAQVIKDLEQDVLHEQGDVSTLWELLNEDVVMIECYRMTLLRQDTSLLPMASLSGKMSGFLDGDRSFYARHAEIFSPENPTPLLSWKDIRQLSRLSRLCTGSFGKSSYEADNRRIGYHSLHRVLLRMGFGSRSFQKDFSRRILGLTMAVALCAPVSHIEKSLDRASSEADHQEVMTVIQNWQASDDCVAATQWALCALEAAQNHLLLERNTPYVEMPHDAHCIFSCGLVLWAASPEVNANEQQTSPAVERWLPVTIKMLSGLRVAISKNMGAILSSILFRAESSKHPSTGSLACGVMGR